MEVTYRGVKVTTDDGIVQSKTAYLEAFKTVCVFGRNVTKALLWIIVHKLQNDTTPVHVTLSDMVVKAFSILNRCRGM